MERHEVRTLLRKIGTHPKRALGQNFLLDEATAHLMVSELRAPRDATIVEIGPGLGLLSLELSRVFQRIVFIEKDVLFAKYIYETLVDGNSHRRLIEGDVRQVQLAKEINEQQAFVISNVPYSISTNVIEWIVEQRSCIQAAQLLLQREFAERLVALPGSKAYGALSVFAAMYFRRSLGREVPPELFEPAPKVVSQMITLRPLEVPIVSPGVASVMPQFVKTLFAARRKKIENGLRGIKGIDSRQDAQALLARAELSPNVRPDAVSPDGFVRLCSEYVETRGRDNRAPE